MNVSNVSSASSCYGNNPWQQKADDFKSLAKALQSGDLTSAQSAFATWQKDLAPASGQTSSTTSPFANNSQANTDIQALGTALQSGDVAGAQKAFASLKQDMQAAGRAHHHHHAPAVSKPADGDADDASQGGSSSSIVSDLLTTSLNVQA